MDWKKGLEEFCVDHQRLETEKPDFESGCPERPIRGFYSWAV